MLYISRIRSEKKGESTTTKILSKIPIYLGSEYLSPEASTVLISGHFVPVSSSAKSDNNITYFIRLLEGFKITDTYKVLTRVSGTL